MVPFAGHLMPVSYAGIVAEHLAVRNRAGLFDLSHMGRIRLRGPDALTLAQRIQTADAAAMSPGRIRYGLICADDGGIIDDILISRESESFLLVVNAGNHEADLEALRAAASGLDVSIEDITDRRAMIAVQGPLAPTVMKRAGLGEACALRYYRFGSFLLDDASLLVSRTGYTGEDGFEIILDADEAEALYLRFLECGREEGVVPAGLGARDTLRLEAGMPLYGHEIDRRTNPFEAGLEFAVAFNHPFIGRAALEGIRETGPARRLIGLVVDGPRVPRQDCPVLLAENEVGRITSGTRSPVLKQNIAMAMVETGAAEAVDFQVSIRGHVVSGRRTALPFYKRKDHRNHAPT